jgi:hypothetical protein
MSEAVANKPIATDFFVSVDGKPHKAVMKFPEVLGDLSFVEKWRETLGANPEPKQREAADLAQLARDRFLADSRVGQPYLTAAEESPPSRRTWRTGRKTHYTMGWHLLAGRAYKGL